MFFKIHLRESLQNLLSAKLRSFLAILGVLVGTASVVALVSGGQLATEHALAQFRELGTDLLAVTLQDISRDGAKGTDKEAESDLVQKVTTHLKGIELSAPYAVDFSSINYDGHQLRGNIVGATETLQKVLKLKLKQGRFISDLDQKESYCVLGDGIYKKLVGMGMFDVMGEHIRVGDRYFTIIGVLEKTNENMFFLVDVNNSIVIPAFAALTLNNYVSLNNIVFKIKSDLGIEKIKESVTTVFSDYFPQKKIFFRSPQEIINGMKKQNETFTLLLGFIGSIALIVGGIGVMNIMLVSVVERRREIGVRMAVGAKRRDIQLMFLTESVVLTLFGGLMGVITGEIVAWLVALISQWKFHFYFLPLIVGFFVSALVGVFFGFYPARKASLLDPIETLRSE
ncbi:MAG: ABC transporter permease [Candidatus Berkiella sp.]